VNRLRVKANLLLYLSLQRTKPVAILDEVQNLDE
jgi:hypothetical protein